jgi:hypothetical protein
LIWLKYSSLNPHHPPESNGYLVVGEYNNQLNAFLVSEPESLLTRSWDEIRKPEGFEARALVAIAYSEEDEMVLILDIEGILMDVVRIETQEAKKLDEIMQVTYQDTRILLADDSSTAMLMMSSTMEQMCFPCRSFDSALFYRQAGEPQHQAVAFKGMHGAEHGVDLFGIARMGFEMEQPCFYVLERISTFGDKLLQQCLLQCIIHAHPHLDAR